jgi:hypothetical protein
VRYTDPDGLAGRDNESQITFGGSYAGGWKVAPLVERIKMVAERHLNETYIPNPNQGVDSTHPRNQCDDWVEKVVKEAKGILPSFWNDAIDTNCDQHVMQLTSSREKGELKPGVYVSILQGKLDSHAQLLIVNEDKSVTVYQQGHLAWKSDVYNYSSLEEYKKAEMKNGEWYSIFNFYKIKDGY